jgi:hypothetical protein
MHISIPLYLGFLLFQNGGKRQGNGLTTTRLFVMYSWQMSYFQLLKGLRDGHESKCVLQLLVNI